LLESTQTIETFLLETSQETDILRPKRLLSKEFVHFKKKEEMPSEKKETFFAERIREGMEKTNEKTRYRLKDSKKSEHIEEVYTPGYLEIEFNKELEKHKQLKTSVKTISEIVGEFNLEQDQKKKSW